MFSEKLCVWSPPRSSHAYTATFNLMIYLYQNGVGVMAPFADCARMFKWKLHIIQIPKACIYVFAFMHSNTNPTLTYSTCKPEMRVTTSGTQPWEQAACYDAYIHTPCVLCSASNVLCIWEGRCLCYPSFIRHYYAPTQFVYVREQSMHSRNNGTYDITCDCQSAWGNQVY